MSGRWRSEMLGWWIRPDTSPRGTPSPCNRGYRLAKDMGDISHLGLRTPGRVSGQYPSSIFSQRERELRRTTSASAVIFLGIGPASGRNKLHAGFPRPTGRGTAKPEERSELGEGAPLRRHLT